MDETSEPPSALPTALGAERLVFFTDAVVAIAMTLLVLPLMESVTEAAAEGGDTAEPVVEHRDDVAGGERGEQRCGRRHARQPTGG